MVRRQRMLETEMEMASEGSRSGSEVPQAPKAGIRPDSWHRCGGVGKLGRKTQMDLFGPNLAPLPSFVNYLIDQRACYGLVPTTRHLTHCIPHLKTSKEPTIRGLIRVILRPSETLPSSA